MSCRIIGISNICYFSSPVRIGELLSAYGTVPIFYGSVCCTGMRHCIVMGKVVVTIIILSANTASCLFYTSRCGVGYTSMITDFVPMILINGYYRFAVDFWRNINRIP